MTKTVKALLIIAGVAVAFVIGYAVVQEHDARLLADERVTVAQAAVKELQAQRAAVATEATKQVIVLQREAAAVQTPAQAIAALPTVSQGLNPEPVETLPDKVQVDAAPLYLQLNECKQTAVKLDACSKELDIETQVATQKDVEIRALKKKPGFWHRVKTTAVTVGVGVAIGAATVGVLATR